MSYAEQRRLQMADSLRMVNAASGGVLFNQVRDVGESLNFLVGQLTRIESEAFRIPTQQPLYQTLVPIDTTGPETLNTILYRMYDVAGRGKRTSGKGTDINVVGEAWAQKSYGVVHGNVGYRFTLMELRESVALRQPLDTLRARIATEAYERHMNRVALRGEVESNLSGLYNNAFVPVTNVTGGTWATKAAAGNYNAILADVNNAIVAYWTQTNFTEMPTRLLLPAQASALVQTSPRSADSDLTVIEYLRRNNLVATEGGATLDIRTVFGLNGAGVGNTNRMMLYRPDPNRVRMHIPMVHRFIAPQPVGFIVNVPGEYRYSGVEFIYPKSALYVDGI